MLNTNNRRKAKIGAILASIIFLLGADRVLKYWALTSLYHQKINIIKNFFTLELWQNENIAFSVYLPQAAIMAGITAIVASLSVLLISRTVKQPRRFGSLDWGILFIIIGALSNLYDRLQFGFVVDYFNLAFLPVFNVADMMISIGAIVLGLALWQGKR
ncbi:signal peptidase II [Candidatus Falkowbacteria bacterium CG10_big_fil_rev_8_21_14_0_10_43_11]|uniref:Lipoprotein signal peptidase n=1 Tax=Candidatus Falkowbacteria bacterium CG10_big_fil_rev_8_21_14_0_10_43_11 TaxID=1974568 RepID=A0A2M6WKY6_9BACT|nr:MAG: signal peptidase II [Candidatus Falkowbacteria bacterium CG10_big_fil_rev_8_21_14_0_10_43_11]